MSSEDKLTVKIVLSLYHGNGDWQYSAYNSHLDLDDIKALSKWADMADKDLGKSIKGGAENVIMTFKGLLLDATAATGGDPW